MARANRVLGVLAALLVVGIGAVVWLALSAAPPERRSADSAARAAQPDEAATAHEAAAAARRSRRSTGNCAVFGEVLRRQAGEETAAAGQEGVLSRGAGESWTAQTDAEGAFRIEALPHGGPFELRVAAPGCGTVRIPGIALDRGEKRDLGRVWLEAAVRVEVRVRSMVDEPIEGARVEAHAVPDNRGVDWSKTLAQAGAVPVPVEVTSTDAEGRAVFPELATGSWTFVAEKEGFARSGTQARLRADAAPAPVVIHLPKGYPLSGRVLDGAKQPIAGALLMASRASASWGWGNSALRVRTVSDDEGRYAFPALGFGEVTLWAGRPGQIPSGVATLMVPTVGTYDVVLRTSGTLAGTVTDQATGKPVEGATVRALTWGITPRAAEAATGPDGKYTLAALAEGTVNRLVAEKEGWVQVRADVQQQGDVNLTIGEGETLVRDLQLRQGARLRGTVTGPAGPMSGVRVRIAWGNSQRGVESRYATADAAGAYAFEGVERGRVLVSAEKEGHYLPDFPENWWQAAQREDTSASEYAVDVPETGEAVKDLRLLAGVAVEGTVECADGSPLAGARVSASGASSGGVTTGEDGRFRALGVTPGPRTWISAQKDGWVPTQREPVPVVADAPNTGFVIRMAKEARVVGTLTAAGGEAVRDAYVQVIDAVEGNPWQRQWLLQSAPRHPVRPDGRFDVPLTGRSDGKFVVRAMSVDHAAVESAPVALVSGQEVYELDLVLEPGGDISGRVVAAGAPVAAAEVVVSKKQSSEQRFFMPGGQVIWAVTDADGGFRVPHLATGSYDVRASATGFVQGTATAEVPGSPAVTVELEPELSITGSVVLADGTGVEGVAITIQPEQRGSRGSPVPMQWSGGQVFTGPAGRFRIRGLRAGQWRIHVQPAWTGGGANVQSKVSEPIAAGATDVKVVVEAGLSISGRVVDSAGKPAVGVQINAQPEKPTQQGGGGRGTQVRDDGTFEIQGLAPGMFTLNAAMPGGYGGRSGASFRPMTRRGIAAGTRDLEIVLEAGLSISGTLVDDLGKPVQNAALTARAAESPGARRVGQQANAMTDPSGAFSIGGLEPGAYRIEMQAWGPGGSDKILADPGEVQAGATGLRLVAAKGDSITGVVVDESGRGVPGARVYAHTRTGGSTSRNAQTQDDGTFVIGGTRRDAVYTVQATAQGRVRAQQGDVAGDATNVRLECPKGLECKGKLRDAEGRGVGQTYVMFQNSQDRSKSAGVMTDADGSFTVQGLVEGDYNVMAQARKQDGSMEMKTLGTVRAGDTALDLRLQ